MPKADENALRIVVVGCGGNTGSSFTGLIPALPGVREAVLIDGDVYEDRNLGCQMITPDDVGRAKAGVQAARLNAFPWLRAGAVRARVEDLPIGRLRGALLISCVDNRAARRWLSQTAWRLGVPLLDCAVDAELTQARVNVYVPGPEAACVQCAWGDAQYAALTREYSCTPGGAPHVAPTGAPLDLGGLAASLMAIEARKLLDGSADSAGCEMRVDALHRTMVVSTIRRSPHCRFDHAPWSPSPLPKAPEEMALRELFSLPAGQNGGAVSLRVPGFSFMDRQVCGICGQVCETPVRLARNGGAAGTGCPACGGALLPFAAGLHDALGADRLTGAQGGRSPAEMGLAAGDIIELRDAAGACAHYEFTAGEVMRDE